MSLMVAAAMVLSSGVAMAQMAGMAMPAATPAPAAGPAAEARRSYEAVKVNVLKSAELMPADAFTSKPLPDVRTYARILNHVTEAQLTSCNVMNGDAPGKPPADTDDKATIVAALKASFDACDKAYGALTDANLADVMTIFKSKRSRISVVWGNTSHDSEQYAQLALYLRLKGITPPSSEK